jgi:hypothetical protein
MKNGPPKKVDTAFLVNRLTVGDARELLLHEGADVPLAQLLTELFFVLLTAGLVAYAIWAMDATVWHLLLPLIAQYVALNVCIPILQAYYRLPDFGGNVIKCFGNIAAWFGVAAIVVTGRAWWFENEWIIQLRDDSQWLSNWIISHHMHWPMVTAFLGFAYTLPNRFRTSQKYGTQFVSIGFGCAMRLLILLAFLFFCLPMLHSTPALSKWTQANGAWVAWGLLLLADLLAFFSVMEIRRRLRKVDGGKIRAFESAG